MGAKAGLFLSLGIIIGVVGTQFSTCSFLHFVRPTSSGYSLKLLLPSLATTNHSQSKSVDKHTSRASDLIENPIEFDLSDALETKVNLPAPILRGHLARHSNTRYSSMECVGDINHLREGSTVRNCLFKNVCYNLQQNNWIYHEPEDVALPKLFESKMGHVDVFPPQFIKMIEQSDEVSSQVSPHLSRAPIPQDALILNATFVIHKPNNYLYNIGHDLWEVLFSIYSNLERFGKGSSPSDVTILLPHGYEISPHFVTSVWNDFGKDIITNHHPLSVDLLRVPPNADYSTVCVETVLPAQVTRAFFASQRPHLWGQEQLYQQFRIRILNAKGVQPKLPEKPFVVITKKSHSVWAKKGKLHRAIANIDSMVMDLRKLLPGVEFHVQEWHKMNNWTEQLELLGRTSILISPAGGVSMSGAFLPDGGALVLMDYLANENDLQIFGCNTPGESCSMEAVFWSAFPHLTKLYYQIKTPSDLIPDDGNDNGQYRDEYSVVVDTTRLLGLIRPMLIRQGYEKFLVPRSQISRKGEFGSGNLLKRHVGRPR